MTPINVFRAATLAAAAGLLAVPLDQPRAQEAIQAPAPQPAKREAGPQAPAGQPATPNAVAAEPSAAPAPPPAGAASAADQIADIFSQVGDQIYADCIFELSDEQVEVQFALMMSYMQQGATSTVAKKLAATQIQPPKLSEECEQIRRSPNAATSSWEVTTLPVPKQPAAEAAPKAPPAQPLPAPAVVLAGKKGLAQWDCAPNVDFVTIKLNGYERKLTGGEICNPFQDVVREVPASAPSFRLGYTIKTGRLFVIADGSQANGQTIAWGLSGRDICRNNPDPDCFAAKAIGPLPPGEYSFAGEPAQRVSWGPRTKRQVVGIYLRKLWNKERFSPQHTAAIMARGNIAIHVRLKGEMSEACIGLEPKGWAYVSSLVKEGRATGINVYIDEPHPQIAEAPPVVVASSFSLTSLFK
jgi:hypothetical protein